jgi:DNA (cytosine-5)-methyltransferase 1
MSVTYTQLTLSTTKYILIFRQYVVNWRAVVTIEIFSFFSGLGFLDLGFHDAGFKISFVNEISNDFISAYKYSREKLHMSPPQYGYVNCDIRDLFTDKEWFDIYNTARKETIIGFIGGPPCPDFSFGGKNQGGTGTNGILTKIYVDLIISKQPDFFVLENVKGLIQTKKHKDFYIGLKAALTTNGYFLVDSLENALEYGVPQYRDRLFLVGFKKHVFGETPDFVLGSEKAGKLSQILKMPWPGQAEFVVNNITECPLEVKRELTVQHWFEKNNVIHHSNSQDYFQPKPTTLKFHTIEEGNTHGKSFKRLHRWRFSPTAAYGNNEVHLHPYQPRRISVAEALSVQSLPQSFELPPTLPLSTKFKMVGNGVPYLMSLGVAKGLFLWLQQHIH